MKPKIYRKTRYVTPTVASDPFGDNFFDFIDELDVECKCGTESVYGSDTNLHSDWCDKFKKFKDDTE